MAGSYPDVPDTRMAWDLDGSTLVSFTGGAITTLSSADARLLNNDNLADGVNMPEGGYLAVIFPEKRDVFGIFATKLNAGGIVQYSLNTTNGQDGTWSNTGYIVGTQLYTVADSRNLIFSTSLYGVRGLRIQSTNTWPGVYAFHIYGRVSESQNVHRLEFWHPMLNERLSGSALDFGDISRGGPSEVRQFRIKNASETKTASNIVLTESALTDSTPTLLSPQHLLSADGGTTYAISVTLLASPGYTTNLSLTPGGISPVVYVKRTTSASAQLGLYALRIQASATFS